MSEEYIKYWGLAQHPFLLAPDGNMMCVTGQYFECFERLKYAINTNKGGALIVSEDAGLGKTTILLKLIDELKEEYGKNFKYAYIDHPTLTASQMIEQITGSVTGQMPSDDKLKNLTRLRESLIETKQEGGKSIIVIDEGQMLCDAQDVLQELRVLINLTHNHEHLHTFILSGQKALWETLQGIPEFWQRLPVRYYFTPLRFEETRELVRYRLNKAGLDVAREIFTEEALEIIHKHSKGLPRTIITLADLALLNGFTDRTRKIGFKEVSKAINAMGGKGESLSYVMQEKDEEFKEPVAKQVGETINPVQRSTRVLEYVASNFKQTLNSKSLNAYARPAIVVVIIMFFVFLGAMGHRLFSSGGPSNSTTIAIKEPEKPKVELPPAATRAPEQSSQQETIAEKTDTITPANRETDETKSERNLIGTYKEEVKPRIIRAAIVNVDGANVRSAPNLEAQRILTIVKGEILTIADEKTDNTGMKWYKVLLYNNRDGWIADKVVIITMIK
jgi:type II secretory pathway predicted ATPase ExeA